MHPYLHEQLMRTRHDELRRQAAHAPGGLPPARPPRRPLRQHVGWLLVHLGLRLALGPARPGRTAPTAPAG